MLASVLICGVAMQLLVVRALMHAHSVDDTLTLLARRQHLQQMLGAQARQLAPWAWQAASSGVAATRQGELGGCTYEARAHISEEFLAYNLTPPHFVVLRLTAVCAHERHVAVYGVSSSGDLLWGIDDTQ